ncbi:MAG: SPOR domain-containing protein [Sulfuriferula sp.]
MAIQATSEEQLRLRRRARRRLLGAGTLLLLAAIVLPMLLDKRPRPLDRDIEIRIPSPTAAPLASAPPVVSSVPAAPVVTPPEAPVATEKMSTPPSPAATEDKQVVPKTRPSRESSSERKPIASKPAVEPKPVQATEKAPEKPVPKAEPAHKKTETVLEKPALTTHFVVQLGAFSNADNVRQLRDKLQAGGIHTYTEALPGGATRVRAGPFKNREQADSTQARIALLGVQSTVVSIDKP